MGIRQSAEPPYQVIDEFGDIQIRTYDSLLVAETVVNADYAEAGQIGFKRLASYIFGANVPNQRMAMTTPVFRESGAEQIAMTAPVLQQADGSLWTMTFVMPAAYTLETLPAPLDAQVSIKTLPPKKVAVLRYSGSLTPEKIDQQSQILMVWIKSQHLEPLSIPRSAAYDPPWTLPALRRNEIHIDIL